MIIENIHDKSPQKYGVRLGSNSQPLDQQLDSRPIMLQAQLWAHQLLYGTRREKTCLRWFANNTGANQPVHPRSLISAFVIRFLKNIICKLATGEISIFYPVSVAEETGLKLA